MASMMGSASRARELRRLFAAWKRAFDGQDAERMAVVKRAIDAAIASKVTKHPTKLTDAQPKADKV